MIEYNQTRNQKQDCALIHILFYSNLDYPFPNVDLEMKITQNIINDLKYFDFTIFNIVFEFVNVCIPIVCCMKIGKN